LNFETDLLGEVMMSGHFYLGDFIFSVITYAIVIAIAVAIVYFGIKIYKLFMKHDQ
jgi:hypothetical protein